VESRQADRRVGLYNVKRRAGRGADEPQSARLSPTGSARPRFYRHGFRA
jgi:hypothetical protein